MGIGLLVSFKKMLKLCQRKFQNRYTEQNTKTKESQLVQNAAVFCLGVLSFCFLRHLHNEGLVPTLALASTHGL